MSEQVPRSKTARLDTNDVIGAALRKAPVFANWPDDAISKLATGSTLQHYEKGDFIAYAGDPGVGVWVIAEGCTATSVTIENGRRIVYEYQMPGQLTGLLPNLDDEPFAFDISAVTPAVLVFVRKRVLLDVVRSDIEYAMDLLRLLSKRARIDYEHLLTKTIDRPRVRLAKFLIYFLRGPDPGTKPRLLRVRATQDMLSALVGVRRQTINQEMQRLIREGLVAHHYGEIVVLNLPALIKVASEDGTFGASARAAVFERPPVDKSRPPKS